MSQLSAIDLIFLLLENQTRPMHMSSCLVFKLPARQKNIFIARLLEAYRHAPVSKPFNQKVKWLERGVAHWETVQTDLNYHVRHVAVPAPGTMAQLDDTLALLNASLLDRAYPLWQCFIIEGLEEGRFALFFKLHHAIIDGEGAVRLLHTTLNESAKSRNLDAIWQPHAEPHRKRQAPVSDSQLRGLLAQLRAAPSGLKDVTTGLLDLGAQALNLKTPQSSLPFQAPNTPFNVTLSSSARCYANCEIPLDMIKAIASASGCTVNDVAVTCIDHALHRYLAEVGSQVSAPLVAAMPLSTRTQAHGTGGNQVTADLVQMGQPGAAIGERLRQVHASAGRVKNKAMTMSAAMRQVHSLLLLSLTALPELTPGLSAAPSSNVLISNMAGPREQLYLGGAPLVAMHGLPILPPTPCLNVTFVSVLGRICLAVASTPEAMSNPARYIELLLAAVNELERAILPRSSVPARSPRKATTGKNRASKKTVKKSRAAKKPAGRK